MTETDRLYQFVESLLDPERFGLAVTDEVRKEARRRIVCWDREQCRTFRERRTSEGKE